ncbi:Scr1 family TA system antitoxin-like transcriptional regulator [Streptomyces sp. NPDC050560]|uniref:helix-turn-helix domain-containing protein n=1 Tax=Streptomyces sp. NPDC050560 TaxID=3365630 RepID=UPI00378F4E01
MNLKELEPDSSPQAAFGAHVRRMRERHGWRQEDLAARMQYSATHVSAVETGRKVPTLRLARSLDRVFGLEHKPDTFEREWREVRNGSMLEGFPEYVGYEGRASEIRVYEVGVVPGLLQTPSYTETLSSHAVRGNRITAEQADDRDSTLVERQALLGRIPPPQIFVVLDESCIRRPIGEPAAMDEQLKHLIEFAERPNTVLQLAPFDIGARRPVSLPFYLLTMPDRSLMCYSESAQQGHLERDTKSVLPLLSAYHQLQAEALSQTASVAMLEQLRKGNL